MIARVAAFLVALACTVPAAAQVRLELHGSPYVATVTRADSSALIGIVGPWRADCGPAQLEARGGPVDLIASHVTRTSETLGEWRIEIGVVAFSKVTNSDSVVVLHCGARIALDHAQHRALDAAVARWARPAPSPRPPNIAQPPVRSRGPVQVRGYYRRNGTYVRPYTRRR